jgi:probable blue pigment (indigoidine) exporter
MLGTPVRALSVIAALAGLSGIAFLILTPQTALDQGLGSWQLLGVCIVFMSVWLSQYASKKTAPLSPAQVAPEPGLSRVY